MTIETVLANLDMSTLGLDPAAASRARTAKLTDGAQQFEAMMLQEMLKPLKFGESPDAAGEVDSSGAGGTMQGYGTEALAKAIASGGGFGIARQIVAQVAREDARKQASAGSKVL